MRITNFSTVRPNMGGTRTAEEFMKFLGANPSRLGIVSQLYDQYTATHLTEALFNTFTQKKENRNFKSIDTFLVEWNINVNRIKRVYLIAAPEGDGMNGSNVLFRFNENYYNRYDTFVVEDTRQQFIVMEQPQRVNDSEWVYIAKINDDDYSSVVDTSGTYVGASTRFVTNYMPEMHEEGYTRYQSNVEAHRIYISTHRTDIDMSAQYLAMEDTFCTIAEEGKADVVYKMNRAERVCLDSFMEARNNALL